MLETLRSLQIEEGYEFEYPVGGVPRTVEIVRREDDGKWMVQAARACIRMSTEQILKYPKTPSLLTQHLTSIIDFFAKLVKKTLKPPLKKTEEPHPQLVKHERKKKRRKKRKKR